MLPPDAICLSTLADRYEAPLATYYYAEAQRLLYVRWHGHLMAPEVIRGAQEAERLWPAHPYSRVLNDKREADGDWREALPWLQYEWLPRALASGIRALAYLVSPHLESQLVSHRFVTAIQPHLHIALFTDEAEALAWLAQQ